MSSSEPITDFQLDRLVDGELPADERRELLVALEETSGGWRRCALAFLEAQSWGATMRGIAASGMVVDPGVKSETALTPSGHLQSSRVAPPRWNSWFVSAAAVLLAFGAGWRMNVAPTPEASDFVVQDDSPAIANPADAVTLVVQDSSGKPQRVRVPLVEGNKLGKQFADASPWTAAPELQNQLEERGLNLATRRRYAPMFFEQKDRLVPMIVPVDDAYVTPVSREVY